MARYIVIEPVKTYSSVQNAIKAVEKRKYPDTLRYFVARSDDGRFFPVFLGTDALQYGVHFHFNIVA